MQQHKDQPNDYELPKSTNTLPMQSNLGVFVVVVVDFFLVRIYLIFF